MSQMEFFHGYFEPTDLPIEPEDTDDFYDLEQEHNCHFVKVHGVLYKFWGSDLVNDSYGFNVVAPPSSKHQLLLYWYNGGAGLHEVAEEAIENWLKDQEMVT